MSKREANRGQELAASDSEAQNQASATTNGDSVDTNHIGEPNENTSTERNTQTSLKTSSASASPRLVFGLSSRTNRARHDEYAAVRGQKKPSSSGSASSVMKSTGNDKPETDIMIMTKSSNTTTSTNIASGEASTSTVTKAKGPRVRSSSPRRKSIGGETKDANQMSKTNPEAVTLSGANKQGINTDITSTTKPGGGHKSVAVDKTSTATSAPDNKTNNDATSKVEADDETTSGESATKKPSTRMQFNIPPPPKVKTNNKSSIVSYAKSRIYDKPKPSLNSIQSMDPSNCNFNLINAESLHNTSGLLLSQKTHDFEHSQLLMFGLGNSDGSRHKSLGSHWLQANSHQLPKSIVSGFKPPKQVDVSKAREKWEGGEPFARCKSKQRLAAAKGKKINVGLWSMTSVVANHQAQFQQQALASSTKGSPSSSSSSEAPVKVLTRGSVLERVQQFEKAPGSAFATMSGADDEPLDEQELEILRGINNTYNLNAQMVRQANEQDMTTSTTTNGFQPATSGGDKTPKTPADLTAARFNFAARRRSSVVSMSGGSSRRDSCVIPRFYHPNGKPNTYEMELERRQIEACFDKFANRRAALRGPNSRRHFQAVASSCNLTEYLKEPLCQYARNWLLHSGAAAMLEAIGSGNDKTSAGFLLGKRQLSMGGAQQRRPSVVTSPGDRKSAPFRSASVDTPDGNPAPTTPVDDEWISCDNFLACWRHLSANSFDMETKFIHLLTMSTRDYLIPEDFILLIQSVIDEHPGLRFLRSAPDFHMRYIQTVIARIYFDINRSWTGKISAAELRRSSLLRTLSRLAQEPDINQITQFFSYEHFYVIYCKFWSLDTNHDLLISAQDLAKHNDSNISPLFIERIFMGIVSRHIQQTGLMSYTDFVWFLIAEEDKKHPRSIEYWFRLMDVDGDGYISMYEMEHFHSAQAKRLPEPLPFVDTACQLLDLINPVEKNKISLSDLKRSKNLAAIFFDTFVNFDKYLEQEAREFISSRDIVINGKVVSDWDRYASEEYESLLLNDTETTV